MRDPQIEEFLWFLSLSNDIDHKRRKRVGPEARRRRKEEEQNARDSEEAEADRRSTVSNTATPDAGSEGSSRLLHVT